MPGQLLVLFELLGVIGQPRDPKTRVTSSGMSTQEEQTEVDVLHIGNQVGILSEAHGFVVGRVVYRDLSMVRIMPREVSDRAIEFPMIEDGSRFIPELGVSAIEVLEEQTSDYYVDFLGARPGEVLEFFTIDGEEAAPVGEVAEVIKSATKDAIKLTDGRTLNFRGVGPKPPIAVVRVRSEVKDVGAVLETGIGLEEEETNAGVDALMRQQDLAALLEETLPTDAVEVIPMAERTYPDAMQREDLFQSLMGELSAKQRTNPRRVRLIEREVDLAMALKNKSVLRDEAGRVIGVASFLVTTIGDAVAASDSALPAVIPIVDAARVVNLDNMEESLTFNNDHVAPRSLNSLEMAAIAAAEQYEDGANTGFDTFMYEIMSNDMATLRGPIVGGGWREAQDVIRTADLGTPVQGLSSQLPEGNGLVAVTLAYLIKNVDDRMIRVLPAPTRKDQRSGRTVPIGVSDPDNVIGYVILPTKAALSLRPPTRPGDLPTALLYSTALQGDNLPTVTATLRDLYTTETGSPQNAWTLAKGDVSQYSVAEWLDKVLRYAVHPIDSLGPRTPALLGLLDSLGLGISNLAPPVAAVIDRWVAHSHQVWRDLLVARRKDIQASLDAEAERTFQGVTGIDSPIWDALRQAPALADVVTDLRSRDPAIADAPSVLTGALLYEAQGDALPLVWTTLATLDGRDIGIDTVAAATALKASREYALRRKTLRDLAILALSAAPEINTCPHVDRLEAIRNTRDELQRSRLLRDFVEMYQGGREGDWMTCTLCRKSCVCYHELMELEAMAQPARMETIQKQILVRFGGDRYEGKIVCRNCGQPLQDIEYDEHAEFDDNGNPIVSRSVLTEDQMAEVVDSVWSKATADLEPERMFTSDDQQRIYETLTFICQAAGITMAPAITRRVVSYTDMYIKERRQDPAKYEAFRLAALKNPKIAEKPMTYEALLDVLMVSGLTAMLALFVQIGNPVVSVNPPNPYCPFSREGWPLQMDGKIDESGPLRYLSCIISFVDRQVGPWPNMPWNKLATLANKQKATQNAVTLAAQIVVLGDPKTKQVLSFTPEISMALDKARNDTEAAKERVMVSLKDELPVGFRPEPFPPKVARPALERVPTGEGSSDAIAGAVHQQALAVIGELHEDATSGPSTIADVVAGSLLGKPESANLLAARRRMYDSDPSVPIAGTHLWSTFETPLVAEVEQKVDEDVFFKLFLKYCYVGPRVGETHEFSVGNTCRQCGFVIGKTLDFVNVEKEGAAILASQQGDLRIEITATAFETLSTAVRRRRALVGRVRSSKALWREGLERLTATFGLGLAPVKERLDAVLTAVAGREDEVMDEVELAKLWTPVTSLMDDLRAEVADKIGSSSKAVTALAMLDQITEDPFIEGPRTVQEYWCAKTEAAGARFAVLTVKGARWSGISQKHNDMIDKLLVGNASWYSGQVSDEMMPVLSAVAKTLGPVMRAWISYVRRAEMEGGPWTVTEAQLLLRCIVFQVWRDAVTPSSLMYTNQNVAVAGAVADWTRALMYHVKQQFVRFSRENIKRVLQERSELERTSVVEEFDTLRNLDKDQYDAERLKKQLRIGRWSRGANIQSLDADTFEFENEQRFKMGVVDAPVDPVLMEGATTTAQDYGFGALDTAPEDGYAVNQGADGDDY